MRGTMIWFNEERDEGYISTEEGERLFIAGSAFAEGHKPEGRCGGLVVQFDVVADNGTRAAADCMRVEEEAPPRARMRRRG